MTQALIPAAALKKHIAILGMNGSGKTSVAKSQVVEPVLAAGGRVCVVDPTGVWWGLRLSGTGKSKGFPVYIVGGLRGDFPLHRRDGKAWAEIVGTTSDSFIFDTKRMTVTDRSVWFTDFAEELLRVSRGPLHLVIDEAHLFAPKSGAMAGGVAPGLLHATNNLIGLGRSGGIRATMISQRPAKLHNDCLSQAHSIIAMALTSPADRKAVAEWVEDQPSATGGKDGKTIIASLPEQAPGVGWIWAPREKVLEQVKFPRPKTFDSSDAPDDVDDEGPKLTPIDPASITARLAVVAKETVANDPAKLRAENAKLQARINQLETQISTAPPPGTRREDAAAIKSLRAALEAAMKLIININATNFFKAGGDKIDPAAIEKAIGEATQHAARVIEKSLEARNKELDGLRKDSGRIIARLQELIGADVTVDVGVHHNDPFTIQTPARALRVGDVMTGGGLPRGKIVAVVGNGDAPVVAGKGERAILTAVAQTGNGATREQLTVVTGYKRSSRDTYLQRLAQAGHVAQQGDRIVATDSGVAALGGDFVPLPTGNALRAHVLDKLPAGEREVLRVAIEAYPEAADREAISEATGYKRSSRDTYLQRLSSRELIEVARGQVRASATLFD